MDVCVRITYWRKAKRGSWASFPSTYYLLSPIAEPFKVTNVFPSNYIQENNPFLSSFAYIFWEYSFSPLFAIRCSNGMYSRVVWRTTPKVEYEGRTCTNNKMAAAKYPVPLTKIPSMPIRLPHERKGCLAEERVPRQFFPNVWSFEILVGTN